MISPDLAQGGILEKQTQWREWSNIYLTAQALRLGGLLPNTSQRDAHVPDNRAIAFPACARWYAGIQIPTYPDHKYQG